MADVEQGTPVSQDPGLGTPEAPPQPEVTYQGGSPWEQDIRASFQDPAVQAQVDAFLKQKIQPHVTQVEQRAAEAMQLYQAFETDPYAAYEAIGRELQQQQAPPPPQYLYDQYGNAYDAQTRQPVAPPQQAAPAPSPYTPPPQQAPQQGDPRFDEIYGEYEERQYDRAKEQFLADPANADINAVLFDQFAQHAETWEEAAAAYRSYAAAWAQAQEAPAPEVAPPQMGDEGDASNTPVEERKSLNDTIDEIWGQASAAPPPM